MLRPGIAPLTIRAAVAVLAFALAGAPSALAQSSSPATPPEYGYGTIPFGATAREVLRDLSGVTIEADDAGEAQFIGHYEVLDDFFTGGLYPNLLGVQQLNTEVTRRYRVSHRRWENVVAIELYFFRDPDAGDEPDSYRLFMARKTLNTSGAGSHLAVSEGLEETISGVLELAAGSYEVGYQPFGQLFALAARVAIWETPAIDIFLLVFQNILVSSNADIVYRDRALWEQYVDAARRQHTATEEKDADKARSVGSSF